MEGHAYSKAFYEWGAEQREVEFLSCESQSPCWL